MYIYIHIFIHSKSPFIFYKYEVRFASHVQNIHKQLHIFLQNVSVFFVFLQVWSQPCEPFSKYSPQIHILKRTAVRVVYFLTNMELALRAQFQTINNKHKCFTKHARFLYELSHKYGVSSAKLFEILTNTYTALINDVRVAQFP